MKKVMMVALMIAGLMAVTAFCASARELCHRGFMIQFDVDKWFTSEPCVVIYTGNDHRASNLSQQLFVTKPVQHTAIEGRVRNEFFRSIASINLHFTIYDSLNRNIGEQIVTLNNLGPQENGSFSVSLDNSGQNARLTGFDFYYKDGACEKVSLSQNN